MVLKKKAILKEIINFNMTETKLMHLKTFPGPYQSRDVKRFKVHYVQDTVPELPLVESTQGVVNSVPLLAQSVEPGCLTNTEMIISTSQPTSEIGSSSKPGTDLVIDILKESSDDKVTLDISKPKENQMTVLKVASAHVMDNDQVMMHTPTTPASAIITSSGPVESLSSAEHGIGTFQKKIDEKILKPGNKDVMVTRSAKRSLNFEPTIETYSKNDPPSATFSASKHSANSDASQVDILDKIHQTCG